MAVLLLQVITSPPALLAMGLGIDRFGGTNSKRGRKQETGSRKWESGKRLKDVLRGEALSANKRRMILLNSRGWTLIG